MTTNDRPILKRVLEELGLTERDVYTVWEGDRLVGLSLGYNNLNELPPEIGNLTELERLNLGDNNLNELPPEIGNLKKLKWFYINNNNLNSLPPEMGNLKKLKELYLSNNNITSSPGVLVSPEIGSRKAQTVYFIKQNKIWCGCFTGTLEEFEDRVLWKYPKGKYHDDYMKFIKQCKEEICNR